MPIALILAATLVGAAPQKAPAPAQGREKYSVSLPNSLSKIDMVPIHGGDLKMDGSFVKVNPFFMATTETVWEVFDLFLMSGPATKPYDQTQYPPDAIARPSKSYILPDLGWGHRGYPVINVSSTTADMFCRWLSSVAGKKYRLPTEAEWEFAARAGALGDWKMDADAINKVSWNASNSEETTQPVATKASNAFGLFDMLGNTGEWTTDSKGGFVLRGPAFNDPVSAVSPLLRRTWSPKWQETDPQLPKSRWWLSDGPFCGFRVVCEG